MANLIRSAKHGCDWTPHDLDSYHISLIQEDPFAFFGLQALPEPSVDQELLNITDADAMQHDNHAQLIHLLDLTTIPQNGEIAVVDFAVELFKVLGYVRQDDILLLVQEDKGLVKGKFTCAEAQLIAGAVAAFNENNINRDAAGLPNLAEKVMPGIVMVGTSPIFFKIPVTETLATHIRHGTYPSEETRATHCYPSVFAHRRSQGMKPLDNRHEILKCYEAFKAIVGI